jgi:transposase
MQISVLGIDLGKNSCSVVGLDQAGRIVLRRRLSRARVIELSSQLPACVIAMEACCGAHHLGRILATLGHRVRLMPPEYVQPYVKLRRRRTMSGMLKPLPKWRRGPPCDLWTSRARTSSTCKACIGPGRG